MNSNQAFQRAVGASRKYTEDSLAGAGALKGIGISSVSIDAKNHLIVNYDKALPDGTTSQDAGPIPTGASFVKDVATASTTWSIQHNLSTSFNELTIITTDVDGNFIFGDIDTANSTSNLLIIKFRDAIAGKAVVKK